MAYPGWAAAVVTCGVLVRVARWAGDRSLNSDELWIAVNLQRRSFAGLRGPLDWDQIAPLGWLWLHKAVLAIGHGDRLLRLPGLVAACTAVALTAVLARRLLPAPLALAAVALVAGAPVLIYQASQLKPYSFEAAASLLLLILALRILDDPARRRLLAFWLAGAAAVWFCTTAIFVVGAVGGLLVGFAALARRWPLVRDHAVAAIPAAASILAVYLMSPPPAAWLYDWWTRSYRGSLAPHHLGVRSGLRWSRDVFEQFARSALFAQTDRARWLVLGLMAAGAVALAVRLPRRAALLCAPVVAAYALALLRLYPMAGRVALWLVPLAWILACAGMDGILRLLGSAVRTLPWRPPAPRLVGGAVRAAAAVVLVLLVAASLARFGRSPRNTNADRFTRAQRAVELIGARWRPGDAVLVHNGKSEAALVDWYGPGARLKTAAWYTVFDGAACADANAVPAVAAASRVWLLRVAWTPKRGLLDFEHRTLARYARPVGEYRYSGSVAALYEKVPGSTPPPGGPCIVEVSAGR